MSIYCPCCGYEMLEVSKDCDHIDCEWEGGENAYDLSIHWECVNGHFTEYNPLIQHAPSFSQEDLENQRCIDKDLLWTKPGESWSLTCKK